MTDESEDIGVGEADELPGTPGVPLSATFAGLPALSIWRNQNSPFAKLFSDQARAIIAPSLKNIQLEVTRGIAEKLAEQQRQRNQLIAQQFLMQFKPIITPQILSAQRELVKSLAIHTSPNAREALRNVAEAAAIQAEAPDEAGFRRLDELLTDGSLREDSLDAAERAIAENAPLEAAIDEAAEALASAHPWLSRKQARRLVVVWVWLMWAGAIFVASVVAPPAVTAAASATGIGAPVAAGKAGAVFDRLFPPDGKAPEEG
ncbi:MAG TPA: hypothetical protein VFT62_06990 [Mycobacteriales bacterium]|nr:hypothetical protein [Mycobacteriales bacterium]